MSSVPSKSTPGEDTTWATAIDPNLKLISANIGGQQQTVIHGALPEAIYDPNSQTMYYYVQNGDELTRVAFSGQVGGLIYEASPVDYELSDHVVYHQASASSRRIRWADDHGMELLQVFYSDRLHYSEAAYSPEDGGHCCTVS